MAVGGIVVIAVLTRIPNLLAIPAFTDEVEEVALGLDILRHGLRPLTNVDPYIGPLWNYILAGALWLSGPSAATPRILMLMAGTLTVLLTYALGRVLHGRRVGLLASTLLATSAMHTAVNSHIAWSNCVTPLFTTAGLLVLARALRDARPRLLVPSGLLFGERSRRTPRRRPYWWAAQWPCWRSVGAGSRARGPIWQGFSRWPATQT